MPDLDFNVESIEPEPYSATPLLLFKIRINQTDGNSPIHAVALRCQIRIEPQRRSYGPREQERLVEILGKLPQWTQTLRSMLWTHASTILPPFGSTTLAELPVPCTFDFNVAMTKYFDALEDGDVPLSLLFSGTIFYEDLVGSLQAAPISWEKEAVARLPARVWHDMMRRHYPNSAFLSLSKDLFDRLNRYKTQRAHPTWDRAIDQLLHTAETEEEA